MSDVFDQDTIDYYESPASDGFIEGSRRINTDLVPAFNRWIDLIKTSFPDEPRIIADFGSGYGRELPVIKALSQASRVIGIDYSSRLLSDAKTLLKTGKVPLASGKKIQVRTTLPYLYLQADGSFNSQGISLLRGDVCDLPLPDNFLHGAQSNAVIMHLMPGGAEASIFSAYRVLRPGAPFLIRTKMSPIGEDGSQIDSQRRSDGRLEYYSSTEQLRQMLLRAGFEVLEENVFADDNVTGVEYVNKSRFTTIIATKPFENMDC